MKKPEIEVKTAKGFERMGTHLFVNYRALDIHSIGDRYKIMIDALFNAVENMDEHGEIFPHNYEEMKQALKKSGVTFEG